ncbi:MAG: hypothetical protein JOZ20_07940 [Sphingomonas sp.]|nr:hypothetical protein [Sphingomonas sp.]
MVVSAYTDQRFRGYSLSDGRPVAILDLSYDASNGIYAAASGLVVGARDDGLKGLGVTLNGGYAKAIRPSLTLDIGAVHSRYSRYSGLIGSDSYTRVYAGLSSKYVGARLSVSPNYIGAAHWTAHGEINGHVDVTRSLLVDGSLGILAPVGRRGYQNGAHPQWDARIGLSQRLGPVMLHAAVTARGRSPASYTYRSHGRAALVLGISRAL